MGKNKNKIIIISLILIILIFTYWWGGSAPGLRGWESKPKEWQGVQQKQEQEFSNVLEEKEDKASSPNTPVENKDNEKITPPIKHVDKKLTADEKLALAVSIVGNQSSEGVEKDSEEYSQSQGMEINKSTGKDSYLTDPVPEGKSIPVEPQEVSISDIQYTAKLSVRCDTILDNMKWLDKEKLELVPDDGVIFPATDVVFYEGESVFNILQREMKKNKIHMEFRNTPIYDSAYIIGINNLYEFDVGELSGWMYNVNGWFPNYGASRYQLKEGDVVEWLYTCNLGIDVGGYSAVGG